MITEMANETTNDISAAVNNLVEIVGKMGQQQVELVTGGIKSIAAAVEPLCKAALEIPGNVFNTCSQTVQKVSTAIAPKA